MHALDHLGIGPAERVATLAWNSARHLEAYFGVPCTGRVLHTLNVRLSAEELAFMLEDAGDRAVLVDPDFLPLLEQALGTRRRLDHVIVLGAEVPDTSLPGVIAYEDLLADEPTELPAPRHRRARARWGSATRRAPPDGPRASSTPTARPSSTPWP